MGVSRKLRERLKAGLHDVFVAGQRVGLDVLPRHFYSGVPDIGALRRSESWKQPFTMAGVAGADCESQLRFLRECCSPFEERLRKGGIHEHAVRENGAAGYGVIEAEFLYCFIAAKRPRRIVQVGSGVSTAVILLAATESGYRPEILSIDPFPTGYLTRMAENKSIQLIPARAQEVDLDVLTGLGAGDLLFIDSTHAVRAGSEVNRLILEALPRLRPGAFVHFHDIYFPYDYQPDLLSALFFSGESTLLQAFLAQNGRYAIAASLSMLHHACPRQMQAALPNYRPAEMNYGLYKSLGGGGHFPSATYLSVS
jgi:predicted O-methyltransferase YrrM